jgi:general secretion pathway protein A
MAAQARRSPMQRFAHTATDVIWLGPTQQAGLAHLCAETQVKVLVGPPSCGKTTLLRHFQQHLEDVVALHVHGPQAGAQDVLSALLTAASLHIDNLTVDQQRGLLRVFVEQRGVQGKRIIVCADEVAGFSYEAWSQIEWLLSIKASSKSLVELAAVGTPADASSSPLNRVVQSGATSAVEAIRYLSAPDDDDIRRYIAWRLERIGVRTRFSAEASRRVNELSENRFAAVNELCEAILALPANRRRAEIGVADVNRAAGLPEAPAEPAEPLPISADEILPDRLILARNGKIERIVRLDRRLVMGQGETSDLKLGGSHICRHHAMFVPTGDGRFAVIDLNSNNGVFVNGERVRRHVLRNGDIVEMGEYRLKLVSVKDGARDAAAARPLKSGTTAAADQKTYAPAL